MEKKWSSAVPSTEVTSVEESADNANIETFPIGTSTTLNSCTEALPSVFFDESITSRVFTTQKPTHNNNQKMNTRMDILEKHVYIYQ